ncbi:hypothetical protein GOBAR_AA30994 [Gossypium barbadense]|uniref:Galactose oxidase-like Early set domain-containing protein n=1 Tax=Gossypium barbadense TaxID=3634 RepID=A0A2P5WF61_GOSBA|nr:hypothetical protein GOBAR_AA30994 [Gossypium barbadense]
MALFWRGLLILPLLFVYASSHFIYTKRHFDKPEVVGFKDLDYLHGDGGGFLSSPIEDDDSVKASKTLKLPGPPCRHVEGTNEEDCFAHSILLDVETAHIRPLRLNYDTWCSSGALDINGRLVSTGGYNNGSDTVRIFDLCDTCEWQEFPGALGNGRWYATQVTLADGKFMVFGGRDFPTYEFVPPEGQKNTINEVINFPFLKETHDPVENNLYPFVFLSTDGNLFVFSNNRSVLLNTQTHTIIHEYPVLPGGAHNYPSSGCASLLPIMLKPNEDRKSIPVEVLVCRLLGDMVVLPTGDVLLVNGAKTGLAGWDDARDPNLHPVLYKFQTDGTGSKFTVLNPSNIPRMYHSSFAVFPDAKILIAGSNTNLGYLDDALFPTEVRVEKFSPHYLDPNLGMFQQEIIVEKSNNQVKYGQKFTTQIRGNVEIDQQKLQVTIYSPPFVTHGVAMNQRLIQLGIVEFNKYAALNTNNIVLQAPINSNIAPPGYYMLFVNYNGVPCCRSMWVRILP